MTQAVARAPRRGADDAGALAADLHEMLTALVERAPLFADLRRQGIAEDLVQDTLLTVTGRIAAGHVIDDPHAYAARCVTNLAKRTYLRGARETATSDAALERLAPTVDDTAERVLQRMTMREVLEMIRSVNAVIKELEPIALELVRAELARTDQKQLAATLGISRPTLYRRKGPAIAAFVAAVADRAGTSPCPEHAGALLAAAGDSGFDGARAAAAHAKHCDQCRETMRHLAVAKHGLALIAPIPLVTATVHHGSALEHAQCAFHSLADWCRQLMLRVGDPMPFGGSAGKTAAIVAAACTGGAGLYCSVQGVPTALTDTFAHRSSAPAKRRSASPGPPPTTAATIRPATVLIGQVASTVALSEEREARAAAARSAAASRRRRAAAAEKLRAQQTVREFKLGGPASTATVREFVTPRPPTSATITRREFVGPERGGQGRGSSAGVSGVAGREFGAP